MRSLNLYCKNKKPVSDSSCLVAKLSEINLESPKNNWEKYLLNGRNKGYEKVFLKLESQEPFFRVKYSIYFDDNRDVEVVRDSTFLRYIVPNYFSKISKEEIKELDWSKKHLLEVSYQGKNITTNKSYVIKNIPKIIQKQLDFKESSPVKSVKVKIEPLQKAFSFRVSMSFLKEDGSLCSEKDLLLGESEEEYVYPIIGIDEDQTYQILKTLFS